MNKILKNDSRYVAVIGLGYVGLPLAAAFSEKFMTLGFDLDESRIQELLVGHDRTNELTATELKEAMGKMNVSYDTTSLRDANFYVVTVPTPVDDFKVPDLEPIKKACKLISPFLAVGDIVVFESTVYPGVTESVCIPILLEDNKLKVNDDLFIGYSPERINPGDQNNKLANITKLISGSNEYAVNEIASVYNEIIDAGVHTTSSIAVAEAAKIIENIQRDVNIALVNEFAMIFNKMGIDTGEVLDAAGTKWNFLKFKPGLVGGHCIGVDPYYLTHKARELGFNPELVLAGRRINDGMSAYAAELFVHNLIKRNKNIKNTRVLILGLTFKENCPDMRNSKILDLYQKISEIFPNIDVHDPLADSSLVRISYGNSFIEEPNEGDYDGVILAVPHTEYLNAGADYFKKLCRKSGIFFDLKSAFPLGSSDLRL